MVVSAADELVDGVTVRGLFGPALRATGAVVLDLSKVTFLAMEAVVPLLAVAQRCAAEQRSLTVVASIPVRRKLVSLGCSR
ncbi:hypothetical protein [Amycolatopsis sp. NPDC051071]|uniref:hypothetical protein n=1 Tax=Amycolatopsis sp. NPDC051071 TaxID=3154637 RepID=UPI00342CC85C